MGRAKGGLKIVDVKLQRWVDKVIGKIKLS